MTHAHKELIQQWLDDPTIEFEQVCSSNVYPIQVEPVLDDRRGVYKFRIKPAPKPDVSFDLIVRQVNAYPKIHYPEHWERANIKFTFDGETGKLKSAEVL